MKLNNLDAATVFIVEMGVVALVVGLLGQSSLASQFGAAAAQTDSAARDFLVIGTFFTIGGLLILIAPDDSSDPASFHGPELNRPTNICAAAIVAGFFLPWAQVAGGSVSGYELGRIGSGGLFALAVPLFAAFVLVNNTLRVGSKFFETVVGALPVLAVLVLAAKSPGNVFKVLGFGAYATCLAGIALIVVAHGIHAAIADRPATAARRHSHT